MKNVKMNILFCTIIALLAIVLVSTATPTALAENIESMAAEEAAAAESQQPAEESEKEEADEQSMSPEMQATIENMSEEQVYALMFELTAIPSNLRKQYLEDGWAMHFLKDPIKVFDEDGVTKRTVARFDPENKTIYITAGYKGVLFQTFARYLNQRLVPLGTHYLSETEEWKNAVAAEREHFLERFEVSSPFSTDNAGMFEQAFQRYCENTQELAEECPAMFAFLDRMVKKVK